MTETDLHEMDEMGAHSDVDGCAWYPKSKFPSRGKAREMFSDFCGELFIDVRISSRFMRWAPELDPGGEYGGEYWVECDKDAPGAFPVWRCE